MLVMSVAIMPTLSAWAQSSDASASSSPAQLSPLVVVGREIPPTGVTIIAPTPGLQLAASDTASLLEDVPGAAVVRNGPLTGIVQLRGLSDDHVGVLVNGMQITPACPNHMDPPLLYIAPSQLHSLTVVPGITSVSLGGDNIGGSGGTEAAWLCDNSKPPFHRRARFILSEQ
jgi:iron complex outermembrane recepter protein